MVFELQTKDKAGCYGHLRLPNIGKLALHQGNGKTYKILDVIWNGETDLWGFVFQENGNSDAPKVWRSFENAAGSLDDGRKRYVHPEGGDDSEF